MVGDLVAVEAGVDAGVSLKGLDRSQCQEWQEAELGALTGLEVTLGPLAQPRDLGDVDLEHAGELC